MIGLTAVIDWVLKFEAEAVVWLPQLLAAELVDHSSIVRYGLVIVCVILNHSFILLQIYFHLDLNTNSLENLCLSEKKKGAFHFEGNIFLFFSKCNILLFVQYQSSHSYYFMRLVYVLSKEFKSNIVKTPPLDCPMYWRIERLYGFY